MIERRISFTEASRNEIQDYKPQEDGYGDGDVPEIDTEPYKNGAWVESPSHRGSAGRVDGLPESSRPRRDGPGGE